MISLTAEHALRAVLYLATRAEPGPVSAETVAQALGAPANYLAKTMRSLARAGILCSARGPGGGYTLAPATTTLAVADIVALFESRSPKNCCLLGHRSCNPEQPCAAHAGWSAVRSQMRHPLEISIAELLLRSPAGTTLPNPEPEPQAHEPALPETRGSLP